MTPRARLRRLWLLKVIAQVISLPGVVRHRGVRGAIRFMKDYDAQERVLRVLPDRDYMFLLRQPARIARERVN